VQGTRERKQKNENLFLPSLENKKLGMNHITIISVFFMNRSKGREEKKFVRSFS